MHFRFDRFKTVNFCLFALLVLLSGCGGGGGGGGGTSTPPAATFIVTGKITNNSAPVDGIMVNLALQNSVTVIASKTTDSNGAYTFPDVPKGTYSVSSTDPKFGFAPVTVTVNDSAVSIPEITAFPVFTISGKVSLANGLPLSGVTFQLLITNIEVFEVFPGDGLFGAKITYPGNETVIKTSDANGVYSFAGVRSGSYTIRPSLSGYVFNPDKTSTITITDNGIIYVYNPELTGNSVNDAQTIIYNSTPLTITDHTLNGQDFSAAPSSGGIENPF